LRADFTKLQTNPNISAKKMNHGMFCTGLPLLNTRLSNTLFS